MGNASAWGNKKDDFSPMSSRSNEENRHVHRKTVVNIVLEVAHGEYRR